MTGSSSLTAPLYLLLAVKFVDVHSIFFVGLETQGIEVLGVSSGVGRAEGCGYLFTGDRGVIDWDSSVVAAVIVGEGPLLLIKVFELMTLNCC